MHSHVRPDNIWCSALLHVQVRKRQTAVGISISHSEKQSTGRVYVRSILIELGKPDDFDTWVKDLVQAGRVEVAGKYAGVDEIFKHLQQKTNQFSCENWGQNERF